MGTEVDRRAQYTTRIPFDATVEVGGALGPSFEAKAVNLSPDGMQLRTAYLPEVGQPVSCSFEAQELGTVLVGGVVIWQEKNGEGGEFGIRFTNIDPESAAHLKKLLTPPQNGDGVAPGSRVRLHIDGLGAPMRGRVRDAFGANVTACSDLNFLQLGKPLDLEDAQTGNKKPATIGSVELEIDPGTQIPQLIVSMRYTDAPLSEDVAGLTDNTSHTTNEAEKDGPPAHAAAAQAIAPSDSHDVDDESSKMKSAWAKKAQNVGPMLNTWAKKTKEKLTAMMKKREGAPKDDVAIPLRRMTSPPPTGALHASGRKVVRSEVEEESIMPGKKKFKFTRRHAAVAGAVGIASILAIVAFRKPAEKPLVASPAEPGAAETTAQNTQMSPPPGAQIPAAPAQPGALPIGQSSDMTMPADDDKCAKGKKCKVAPFSNGIVAHGNVLRLKMDGTVEKIQGAAQPTGFTVVIPNRKSEEAAAPLAARDSRIAGINVANNPTGAELTVTFKDGVPNYQVRARGSYIEIVLAQGSPQPADEKDDGAPKSTAKKGGHGHHKKH